MLWCIDGRTSFELDQGNDMTELTATAAAAAQGEEIRNFWGSFLLLLNEP